VSQNSRVDNGLNRPVTDQENSATAVRHRWRAVRRAVARSRAAWIFIALVVLFIAFAVIPWVFAPLDPLKGDLLARLQPPGSVNRGVLHILGTDQLGRDVWSRVIYGTRVSLLVAASAVILSGAVGATLGILAGTLRGWVGAIIMRFADMVLSVPFILLAILTVVVLGPSVTNLVLCLALVRWTRYARVAYAQTLDTNGREFVVAAVAIGSTRFWVVRKHIIPEVLSPVIVVATLELGLMVIFEASLSFLGLGVQPPTPSWGVILSDGQQYVATAWWLATFPGLALFLLVLSVNMLGDFVRDRLDPSERALRA
jgi:peptide/nickel transport system permease protein